MKTALVSQMKLRQGQNDWLVPSRMHTNKKQRREYGTEFNDPGLDFKELSTDLHCRRERVIFVFKLQAGTPALMVKSLLFAVPDVCYVLYVFGIIRNKFPELNNGQCT